VIVEVENDENRDYLIRKRAPEFKEKYARLFGHDIEKIKELKKEQFETFIKYKNDF
jgi:hypothetical protein